MKYQALSATLLMFSAIAFTPVYASDSLSATQNSSDTAASQQAAAAMDRTLKQIATKYDKEISTLGLSTAQLNAVVYVRPDWIREPIPFSTLREFVGVLFAQPNVESLELVKEGEFLGLKVKITGHPADGYTLYPQEHNFLLKGIVDDESILEATDAREEELLFQLFRKKAMIALTENGFKG